MDFKHAFEQALVGMVYVSAEGRILRANRKLLEMLGYSLDELTGLHFFEIAHPDHRARDLAAISAMLCGKASGHSTEGRYLRRDGRAIWASVNLTFVREGDDVPPYFFITVVDITARKEIEGQLRESQELLSTMFSAAKVGLAVSTFERRLVKVNPAFAAMLGYTEDELRQLTFQEIIHPDDRKRDAELFEQASSGERNYYRMELRYLHKLGHEIWARIAVSRLWHSNDELTHYQVTVCDDITELRAAERTLDEQRAKIAASSKLTALGEMAGGIAHEINNPIAIIYASAQQAREVIGDDEAARAFRGKLLERIERTSMRVANIVKSLRNLSRDGELDVMRSCSVKSVMEDALELCREKMKNSGIELRLEIDPPGLPIHCRSTQLSQVILNLLSNAYDAVQEVQDRWIEVKATDCGDRVQIAISDSGKGVPPALRERILEPFFTTKAVGKGTGLGLSISRNIMTNHGGSLLLDPNASNTRFVIELPKPFAPATEKAA